MANAKFRQEIYALDMDGENPLASCLDKRFVSYVFAGIITDTDRSRHTFLCRHVATPSYMTYVVEVLDNKSVPNCISLQSLSQLDYPSGYTTVLMLLVE